jgi:hypothetical protein
MSSESDVSGGPSKLDAHERREWPPVEAERRGRGAMSDVSGRLSKLNAVGGAS